MVNSLAINHQVSAFAHFLKYHRAAGAVDGLPRRKPFGQVAPNDAVFSQIKDGFTNALKRPNTFAFDANKFFDTLPLRGRQVGGIRLLHTT